MKAKDITECKNCPLYKNDCVGGWTSNGSGTPIEPPCCSWNDDDEIYEDMYSLMSERDYSEQELQWEKRATRKKRTRANKVTKESRL